MLYKLGFKGSANYIDIVLQHGNCKLPISEQEMTRAASLENMSFAYAVISCTVIVQLISVFGFTTYYLNPKFHVSKLVAIFCGCRVLIVLIG